MRGGVGARAANGILLILMVGKATQATEPAPRLKWTRCTRSSGGVLRSDFPTAAPLGVYGAASPCSCAPLYVSCRRERPRFPRALHLDDLAICLAGGLLSVPWSEGLEALRERKGVTRHSNRPECAGGLQDVVGIDRR